LKTRWQRSRIRVVGRQANMLSTAQLPRGEGLSDEIFKFISRGIYNFINTRGRIAPENQACLLAQRFSYSRSGCKSSEIRIFLAVIAVRTRRLHRNLSPAAVINNAAAPGTSWYITHNDVITSLHFRGPLLLIPPRYLSNNNTERNDEGGHRDGWKPGGTSAPYDRIK